jgi:hypothetical protein
MLNSSGSGDLPPFRKSSRCESGGCVEVAVTGSEVFMRDAKHADSPILAFSASQWAAFLEGIRNNDFDLA